MLMHLHLNPLNQLSICAPDLALTSITEEDFLTAGYSWQKEYTWNGTAFQEIVPPPAPEPTFEQLKEAKKQQLNSSLQSAQEEGYLGQYRALDKNRADYGQMLQSLQLEKQKGLATDATVTFWMSKTGPVDGTIGEYETLMVNYGVWVRNLELTYWQKMLAIEAAINQTELDAINITLP